jgi:hypothetical protein
VRTHHRCGPPARRAPRDVYYNGSPYPPGTLEDELPRSGLLQPGNYNLCVNLTAYSRIGTNQPAGGEPDDPTDKNHSLELTFTVQ